ncbi:MAG: OsmC family protein [Burkholderiales bacterium]
MPETFQIRVAATCPTHARTEAQARHHRLVIDEPPSREGSDLGPSPLETMLAAFLGCTNVVANMIADDMGIHIETMDLKLVGHLDTRGVFGKAEVSVPFPRIELKVDLITDATEPQIDALKRALAKRCPVSVILRAAGCRIEEQWSVSGKS